MHHWSLVGERTVRLSAQATLAWRHNRALRDDITADCRVLAASYKGPITVTSASGRHLAVIGTGGEVQRLEDLPGALGVPFIDGER